MSAERTDTRHAIRSLRAAIHAAQRGELVRAALAAHRAVAFLLTSAARTKEAQP